MNKTKVFHWALGGAAAVCAIVSELFTTGMYSHAASAATVLFITSLVAKEIAAANAAKDKLPPTA
jgi:hypothetical protein